MLIGLLFLLFLPFPLSCMELSDNLNPEQAYNFLITHNPAIEKQEAIEHLGILVALLYHAGHDYIESFFVHPLPLNIPIKAKAHIVIRATEISLNAYAHAVTAFLKTINDDNKTKKKRVPFGRLEEQLRKETEILNKWYQPAMIALCELAPAGDCLRYPEEISLEYFLSVITGYKSVKEAIAHFYFFGSST